MHMPYGNMGPMSQPGSANAVLATHLMLMISNLLLMRANSDAASNAARNAAQCRPQGLLVLESPYEGPRKHPLGLPLCSQYGCSCCNRSHVTSISRLLSGAVNDASFSKQCFDMLALMYCRICDPEVGIGSKPTVCRPICKRWHAACRNDFFGFDSRTGQLMPCSEAAAEKLLVCSKLSTLAPTPEELCEVAELSVSDGDACFDGSGTSSSMRQLCESAPVAVDPTVKKPKRARSPRRRKLSTGNETETSTATWLEFVGDWVTDHTEVVLLLLLLIMLAVFKLKVVAAAARSAWQWLWRRRVGPPRALMGSSLGGSQFPGQGRRLGGDIQETGTLSGRNLDKQYIY